MEQTEEIRPYHQSPVMVGCTPGQSCLDRQGRGCPCHLVVALENTQMAAPHQPPLPAMVYRLHHHHHLDPTPLPRVIKGRHSTPSQGGTEQGGQRVLRRPACCHIMESRL